MEYVFQLHQHRYFPYELDLAVREVKRLCGCQPVRADGCLMCVSPVRLPTTALRRLTYFAWVEGGGQVTVPDQALLEASANGACEAAEQAKPARLTRQSTRYSTHGLHEYKGKFNPQVVRAIGNLLGLDAGAWVLDPFCGSGTTLLEAYHNGWNALGIDLHPLAVKVANAKLRLLRASRDKLREHALRLEEHLRQLCEQFPDLETNEQVLPSATSLQQLGWPRSVEHIPNAEYLQRWFQPAALAKICYLRSAIRRRRSEASREFAEVVLSDILRDVSLQDPEDLRIRRRKCPAVNPIVFGRFAQQMASRLQPVLNRPEIGSGRTRQKAIVGDARRVPLDTASGWPSRAKFDAVITSPPYATALPYVDMHRLSLCLLGLVDSGALARQDSSLIGARDITPAERRELEARLLRNDAELPAEVMDVLLEIRSRVLQDGGGFRKMDKAALLYRYFADMKACLSGMRRVLRPGSPIALIVGVNRVLVRPTSITIDTPTLLGLVGADLGMNASEATELNTYSRYGLHQANAIRSESLVVLRT